LINIRAKGGGTLQATKINTRGSIVAASVPAFGVQTGDLGDYNKTTNNQCLSIVSIRCCIKVNSPSLQMYPISWKDFVDRIFLLYNYLFLHIGFETI
jgi:hypothetical protein